MRAPTCLPTAPPRHRPTAWPLEPRGAPPALPELPDGPILVHADCSCRALGLTPEEQDQGQVFSRAISWGHEPGPPSPSLAQLSPGHTCVHQPRDLRADHAKLQPVRQQQRFLRCVHQEGCGQRLLLWKPDVQQGLELAIPSFRRQNRVRNWAGSTRPSRPPARGTPAPRMTVGQAGFLSLPTETEALGERESQPRVG